MGGLPSLNRVFKPVLNLASYIRYCLAILLNLDYLDWGYSRVYKVVIDLTRRF